MSKTCLGCGTLLQTKEPEKKGYTKDLTMDFCVRCFRLTHYKEYKKEEEKINPIEVLKKINKQKGHCFFFIDFINLHEEALNYFKKINLPKTLVISKQDTIPKSIYKDNIRTWLKNEYKIEETIIFLQKEKKSSKKKLLEKIEEVSLENIFLIGITNAGKSTMVNELLEEPTLTISEFANTTLDFVELKILEKHIFDTPGLVYEMKPLDIETLKKANIKKEIKPKTYLLKKEATLNLEEEVFISLSKENSITWFGSENLNIKKEYGKKRENLEQIKLNLSNNSNLYLKGIGFFYIKNACELTIKGVKKEEISISKSFFKEKV